MKKLFIIPLLCGAIVTQAQIIGHTTGSYTATPDQEHQLHKARLLYNEKNFDMAEVLLRNIIDDAATTTVQREAETILTLIASAITI